MLVITLIIYLGFWAANTGPHACQASTQGDSMCGSQSLSHVAIQLEMGCALRLLSYNMFFP